MQFKYKKKLFHFLYFLFEIEILDYCIFCHFSKNTKYITVQGKNKAARASITEVLLSVLVSISAQSRYRNT